MTDIKADNQSVAARTITNSPITFTGYSQADYEEGLRDREKALRHEYASLAVSLTSEQVEKRVAVEREMAVVAEKLGNIEASYADALRELKQAKATNMELEGQVPAKQLEAGFQNISGRKFPFMYLNIMKTLEMKLTFSIFWIRASSGPIIQFQR